MKHSCVHTGSAMTGSCQTCPLARFEACSDPVGSAPRETNQSASGDCWRMQMSSVPFRRLELLWASWVPSSTCDFSFLGAYQRRAMSVVASHVANRLPLAQATSHCMPCLALGHLHQHPQKQKQPTRPQMRTSGLCKAQTLPVPNLKVSKRSMGRNNAAQSRLQPKPLLPAGWVTGRQMAASTQLCRAYIAWWTMYSLLCLQCCWGGFSCAACRSREPAKWAASGPRAMSFCNCTGSESYCYHKVSSGKWCRVWE